MTTRCVLHLTREELDTITKEELQKREEALPTLMKTVFADNIPLMEMLFLVYRDENTRFAGSYDTKNDKVQWLGRDEEHDMDYIYKHLPEGLTRFSYFYMGEHIIGIVFAYNEEYALKTVKMMERQPKEFEPLYYMLEIDDGKSLRCINVDGKGNKIYENYEKDCEFSEDNLRKSIKQCIQEQKSNR